ncbi:Hsp70 family protein [Gordonia sp. CPCC 206044]|uniref:Hsp70 family protein n=1 Tax=Gordonia sp. CPCC 206044 TaxID=3140793 RepID=UPI003AF3858E
MGISAGDGMIHHVLLTRDNVGRNVVDSRVIDVDRSDGLDVAGRVNAGIELMLGAARDAGRRVGPIGVAARTAKQRRELRSRGSGPRRQIHLVADDEAVVAYLSATGHIGRFENVVVADCGDTGMTLFTVETATNRISATERSRVLAGRQIDRSIVSQLSEESSASDGRASRPPRRAQLSACRTAKEELSPSPSAEGASVPLGDGHVTLTAETVAAAAAPMVDEARKVLKRYMSESVDRGVRPEAVVFVGGIANLPAVRGMADGTQAEVVVPEMPELAAAMGAAILAGAKNAADGTSRLAFIGGKKQWEWLSGTPLAVAGALLAATMMTIYAVSSALTGNSTPVPSPSQQTTPSVTSVMTTTDDPESTTRTTTTQAAPRPQVPVEPTAPVEPTTTAVPPETRWNESPGWATTELPPTPPPGEQSTPSTTTRTLSPYPLPSWPWTPPGTQPEPTIPPDLLPPGMRQDPSRSTPPSSSDPTTSAVPQPQSYEWDFGTQGSGTSRDERGSAPQGSDGARQDGQPDNGGAAQGSGRSAAVTPLLPTPVPPR